MVRARCPTLYKQPTNDLSNSYLPWRRNPLHVLGLWAMGILHSTATLSSESARSLYGDYSSCTVSIFSCPASALGLGGLTFFGRLHSPTLTPMLFKLKHIYLYRYVPSLTEFEIHIYFIFVEWKKVFLKTQPRMMTPITISRTKPSSR